MIQDEQQRFTKKCSLCLYKGCNVTPNPPKLFIRFDPFWMENEKQHILSFVSVSTISSSTAQNHEVGDIIKCRRDDFESRLNLNQSWQKRNRSVTAVTSHELTEAPRFILVSVRSIGQQ